MSLLPKQASPVRPQSLGAGSREPEAEPAPPKADLVPPPPLMQPKGRLEVQQATRLTNELNAMQRGLPTTARAPVVEVRTSSSSLNSVALQSINRHDALHQGCRLSKR